MEWYHVFIFIIIVILAILCIKLRLTHNIICGGSDITVLPFTDEFQLSLEAPLKHFYNSIKIDLDVPQKFEEFYKNKISKYKDDARWESPLVAFKIQNNQCIINSKNVRDNGITNIVNKMINDTIIWAIKNNLKIPETTLYVYISDSFPRNELFHQFPIFVFARPRNINLPIFPDVTFDQLTIHKKYKGTSYNWDEMKEKIKYHNISKNNIIFFHGTNTTKTNHNMRQKLLNSSKNIDIPLKISLNAWEKYIPVWSFAKYKYLLNLPGRYPWSNRIKYIMLMSTVINISVKTIYIDTGIMYEPWETILDFVIKPNKHYIDIVYTYYTTNDDADEKIKQKAIEMMKIEDEKLPNNIIKAYNDAESGKYKYIMHNGKNMVENLSLERIYQYIFQAITLNSKYINNY